MTYMNVAFTFPRSAIPRRYGISLKTERRELDCMVNAIWFLLPRTFKKSHPLRQPQDQSNLPQKRQNCALVKNPAPFLPGRAKLGIS